MPEGSMSLILKLTIGLIQSKFHAQISHTWNTRTVAQQRQFLTL